jgi:hypothetical protein
MVLVGRGLSFWFLLFGVNGIEVDVISSFMGVTVIRVSSDSELHAINNEEITSTSIPFTPNSKNQKDNPRPTKTIQNLETTPIPSVYLLLSLLCLVCGN